MILLPQNKDGGVSFMKHADVCGGVEEGGPVASQRTGKTGPPRRARPTGVGTADSSPALPGPLPDEVPWLAHESADSWPLLSRRSPETSQALSSDSDRAPGGLGWCLRTAPSSAGHSAGSVTWSQGPRGRVSRVHEGLCTAVAPPSASPPTLVTLRPGTLCRRHGLRTNGQIPCVGHKELEYNFQV